MAKRPNVLLLGFNYGSVMNSLVVGFLQEQIPVYAITFDSNIVLGNKYDKIFCVFKKKPNNKISLNIKRIIGLIILLYRILWADVIHIYYDSGIFNNRMELRFFKFFRRKKKFITFLGSEIRNPEVGLKVNPYYHLAYNDPNYEYKHESLENSNAIQSAFAKADFKPIVWDVDIYLNKRFFPTYYIVPHASINETGGHSETDDNKPGPILIVHAPTAPIAKGSKYIIEAIEQLQERGIKDFEFKILKGLSNEDYQQYLRNADILVDQIIWGAYGISSAQALEYGKIVVCYLLEESVKNNFGLDCPIRNATVDNLADVLEQLIANKNCLKELRTASINYYKKMHAPEVVAQRMLAVYNL